MKGGHVWHCSLSLRADEGALTDEQWGAIARDFITAMEFEDNEGTKAPCRWVAMRHGVSKNGNDHVHVAVNLVREDGTKASTHRDFRRAQTAARALEAKYGLEEVERREGTAGDLEAKGIGREVVATRMRADISQAEPATEAVKAGAAARAPKARIGRGRTSTIQRNDRGR